MPSGLCPGLTESAFQAGGDGSRHSGVARPSIIEHKCLGVTLVEPEMRRVAFAEPERLIPSAQAEGLGNSGEIDFGPEGAAHF
jgi:hypothetical protein